MDNNGIQKTFLNIKYDDPETQRPFRWSEWAESMQSRRTSYEHNIKQMSNTYP
jgi:hypothetical protein